MSDNQAKPALLILNQMAGPMTWELAEDAGGALGCVALLTGHPDTLQKSHPKVLLQAAAPYQRGSFPRRALSWLHYWLQAFIWLWHWPADTPVLLFSNPPILCWLGWLTRTLRGQRYVVMVHDIYPDVLLRVAGYTEHHPLVRLWRWFNRYAYERAEVVITLGEYMAEALSHHFDPTRTRQGRIEIIYPWVDTERIKPIPKTENSFAHEYNQVGKLTVMYSGNMGLGHDIETMLEAAHQLRSEEQIHFMFIGAGPKWALVQEAIVQKLLPNVTLLGWQPEELLSRSLAAGDVAMISLEPEIQGLAVPSKTVYALAAGSALVVLAGEDNEPRKWVSRFECGVGVDHGDATGLVSALRMYLKSPETLACTRACARNVAIHKFHRTHNTDLLLDLLITHDIADMKLGVTDRA